MKTMGKQAVMLIVIKDLYMVTLLTMFPLLLSGYFWYCS